MDVESVVVCGLSFLLVLWVVWQLAEPLLVRPDESVPEEYIRSASARSELDREEFEEDKLSGKIHPVT